MDVHILFPKTARIRKKKKDVWIFQIQYSTDIIYKPNFFHGFLPGAYAHDNSGLQQAFCFQLTE